jgi:6-pyruvoyltetrahydropterin/6-carboxytetrahydropterin synthase
MRTSVTKLYRFSASHRLHISRLSEEENDRLYGKCNNPFGHGHNYVLEITAEGPVDEKTGMAVLPSELDRLVQECVLCLFSDRNINLDIPQFQELVPTTENIAKIISELLCRDWSSYITGSSRLSRVHVQETDRNGFEIEISKEHTDPREHANADGQSEKVKVAG